MKAEFRAWLIDLVREAIRIERTAEQVKKRSITSTAPKAPISYGHVTIPELPEGLKIEKIRLSTADYPGKQWVPKNEPIVEPSFEQMQSDALKEQVKFYEVKK